MKRNREMGIQSYRHTEYKDTARDKEIHAKHRYSDMGFMDTWIEDTRMYCTKCIQVRCNVYV